MNIKWFWSLFHEYRQNAVLWSSGERGWAVMVGVPTVDLDGAATFIPARESELALKFPWLASWRGVVEFQYSMRIRACMTQVTGGQQ